MRCNLCPRHCNALRTETAGEGACHSGTLPAVVRAARHDWEEPCISGTRGSGTVFFSGCALGCVFCQNAAISHGGVRGRILTPQTLSELFQRVEALGVQPLLVQGDSRNLKLTLPQDEYIVRLLLADKTHAPA